MFDWPRLFERWITLSIHQINHCPADSVDCFVKTYPLDSIYPVVSVVQPSNNQGLDFLALNKLSYTSKSAIRYIYYLVAASVQLAFFVLHTPTLAFVPVLQDYCLLCENTHSSTYCQQEKRRKYSQAGYLLASAEGFLFLNQVFSINMKQVA